MSMRRTMSSSRNTRSSMARRESSTLTIFPASWESCPTETSFEQVLLQSPGKLSDVHDQGLLFPLCQRRCRSSWCTRFPEQECPERPWMSFLKGKDLAHSSCFIRMIITRIRKLITNVIAATTRSHLFFEQASNDLAAYAGHAGRRTVDETDVELLMKRLRILHDKVSMESLLQRYLPRELRDKVLFPDDMPSARRR
ncbi:hypothetical protein K457DRAFT_337312 [Linnemannia elongata AG-77]|uniref:CENP-T/Histone H4 histone fold domain-containing protein n=1 Tax=Linnemannia elongata AG-77 TaxID=1314771 RepID=A0A197K2L0_9FUNG|nr:hypothetical protein K457DRAFT_337312 [Linnemannia elongata AG-77]